MAISKGPYKKWSFLVELVKRFNDIFWSLLALICLSPVFIIVSILIVIQGGSSLIYAQERIGKGGKPFKILKFRSMIRGAEEDGPQLADDDDVRITPIGRILRKWRLDELPQFLNVLAGQMSIVGPRPERKFYIDQIVEKLPEYEQLLNVHPGITSAGMVEYGYAQTVDEMIERAAYDLDYVKNLSLLNDVKVILKTIKVIIDGKGK